MRTVKVGAIEIGSGIPKICVPVFGKTKEEIFASAEAAARSSADFVEWRADWFEDVCKPEELKKVLSLLKERLGSLPLLFTFRTLQEGGETMVSPEKYKEMNCEAAKSGFADLVDVELSAGEGRVREITDTAHGAGVKVILSSHDFEKTPSFEVLLDRLLKMQETQADILKVAVMPQSEKDVIELLAVTEEMTRKYADRPVITMSMAAAGVVSRVCGETFGSAVTFGSAGRSSAPGQMDAEQLRTVLELLHAEKEKQ